MINKKDEIIRKIYFTDNLSTHSTFNCLNKKWGQAQFILLFVNRYQDKTPFNAKRNSKTNDVCNQL